MKRILAIAAVLALGTMAQAAMYNVTGLISNAWDPTFTNTLPTNVSTNTGVAAVYQVDLYVAVSNLQTGQRGFGNVVLNLGFAGNSLGTITNPGWNPNNPTVDTNGAAPGGLNSLFATNGDFGANSSDLQNIIAGIAVIATPNVNDPRPLVGQPSTFLGSVYVDWDGVGPETMTISVAQASYASSTNGQLVTDTAGTLLGSTITFGSEIPEPATIGLLAIGGLVMITRRR